MFCTNIHLPYYISLRVRNTPVAICPHASSFLFQFVFTLFASILPGSVKNSIVTSRHRVCFVQCVLAFQIVINTRVGVTGHSLGTLLCTASHKLLSRHVQIRFVICHRGSSLQWRLEVHHRLTTYNK